MRDDVMTVDARTAGALANTRRQQVLLELSDPSTISQLARRLSMNKGSVSHHLHVLLRAGLVVRAGARTVRGGTEIYYERTSRRVVIAQDERLGAGEAMVQAVAEGMSRDRHRFLHHRTLRLTRRQADHLAQHLDELIASLEPDRASEQMFGVVVGVYRRAP